MLEQEGDDLSANTTQLKLQVSLTSRSETAMLVENVYLQNESCALSLQPTYFKRCNIYFSKDKGSLFSVYCTSALFSFNTAQLVFADKLASRMQTIDNFSNLLENQSNPRRVFGVALYTFLQPISSSDSQQQLAKPL